MNSTTIGIEYLFRRGSVLAALGGAVLAASLCQSKCWGQAGVAPPQNGAVAPADDAQKDEVPVAQADPAARELRYWTTNWSFRDINIGTLSRRLNRIGIAIPAELEGTVSVNFEVSVPINALRDAAAYRIAGNLVSPQLRIESTVLSLNTEITFLDGVASLTNLRGALFGDAIPGAPPQSGDFQGAASLRLAGEGDRLASVALDVQQVQLEVLTGVLRQDSDLAVDATGSATGSIQWVAPVDSITSPLTWDARAQLAVQNLSIDNRPPLDLDTGQLRIVDGQVSIPRLRINVVNVPAAGLEAEFDADLRDTQRWSARVVSQRLPIESVAAVLALGAVPATEGELTLDLTAQGSLSPLDWQVEGELQSPGLAIYGVRLGELNHSILTDATSFDLRLADDTPLRTSIQAVRADYAITPLAIDLAEIDAQLFGGQIRGDVRWARDPSLNHEANLDWSALALRWDVGAVTSGVAAELLVSSQGRLAWNVLSDSIELPAAHTLRASLQVDNLAVAGQSIGTASLQIRAVEGELAIRGEGALLGGTFEVDSTTEIPAKMDWSTWLNGTDDHAEQAQVTSPLNGRLQLRGISLARTGAILNRLAANAGPGRGWSGRGDADVQFDLASPAAGGTLVTRSTIGLYDFAIDRNRITRELLVNLRSRGDQIEFDSVRGTYAGGSIELAGRWALMPGPRQLEVRFNRVDASRAFLPFSRDAISWFQGELSGQIQVIGEQSLKLVGAIEGRRILLFGVPLGAVRSGLTGIVTTGGQGWEFRFPNLRSTLARGRIAGGAVVSQSFSGRSFDLKSSWTAMNVDFENLISGLGSTRNVGRGNLTGSLTLDGRNISGAADLVGRFDGTLAGTQASAVPGLNRARSYIGPIGGSALIFTEGAFRGQIRRNLVLLDRLALRSDRLRVSANGSIRLDNSRMNIEAIAATGDFSAQGLVARAAVRQLAVYTAPPVGLLLSLNQLVNDRTLYLQIRGTPGSPVVRVRPLETLGSNALLFFLQEITLGGSAVAFETTAD